MSKIFIGFFVVSFSEMSPNVSRTREVAMQAKRVFSANIKFIRENRVEATQNQQCSLMRR